MSSRFSCVVPLLALAGFGVSTTPASAQMAPLPESRLEIARPRGQEVLRREREESAVVERVAADSAGSLRVEVSRARARIDIHKSELETIKRRLDLAKRDKQETERTELEAARKLKEAELRLLERMHSLREAQFRVAEGRRDAARAWRRAVEAEQTLEARSATRLVPAGDSLPAAAADPEVRRSARRMVELRRDAFAARRDLAERERLFEQRQLDALDAQTAVLAPRR
jgi:hypothetical protein